MPKTTDPKPSIARTTTRIQDRRIRATRADQVTLLFRAFADRTRLRMLHLLRDGELCVGDIVQVLKITQPTASRHLANLRRSGLVTMRKEGLWVFYSLTPARGPVHQTFLDCLNSCFREVPELAADHRRARTVRRSGGCCPTPRPR
jgi:ArsR family transcriptional regulator